jgi:hypothetical protein
VTRSAEVVEAGKDVTERGVCRLDREAVERFGRDVVERVTYMGQLEARAT